jgi:hypothetical protein
MDIKIVSVVDRWSQSEVIFVTIVQNETSIKVDVDGRFTSMLLARQEQSNLGNISSLN